MPTAPIPAGNNNHFDQDTFDSGSNDFDYSTISSRMPIHAQSGPAKNQANDPLSRSSRSSNHNNYDYSTISSLSNGRGPAQLRSSKKGTEELLIVKKAENSQRERVIMAELTFNKLKIQSLGLIGREQEIAKLKSYHRQLETQEVAKMAGFLHGFSGVGKSKLAQTLQREVSSSSLSSKQQAIYAEGKYDFMTMDEPFSGIVQAYKSLCNQIQIKNDPKLEESVKHAILENMPEEAVMLTELISELGALFRNITDLDSSSTKASSDTVGLTMSNNKRKQPEHWRHAFRILTQTLGSFFHPIVMVLDDLQME